MYKAIDYIIYPAEIEKLWNDYENMFSKNSIIEMYKYGLNYNYIKRMIILYLYRYKPMGYTEEYFLQIAFNISQVELVIKNDLETTKKEIANIIKREPVPNSKNYRIQNKNKRHY